MTAWAVSDALIHLFTHSFSHSFTRPVQQVLMVGGPAVSQALFQALAAGRAQRARGPTPTE